jgi:glutamate dehydrogenase
MTDHSALLHDARLGLSERLGRPLTTEEQSFVAYLLADTGIAAQSWGWTEGFQEVVGSSNGVVGDPTRFLDEWRGAFGAGYREMFDPAEALADIVAIEDMGSADRIGIRAYRHSEDSSTRFRFKLYHRDEAAPLADVLAILEPMGLRAMVEEGFPARPASGGEIWVHEFLVDDPRGAELVLDDVAREFEAAFVAIWNGETENDGFNRLVLQIGAPWRDAAAIRALARYRQQTRLDGSQRTQIRALVEHAHITRLLIELFRVKFDPDSGETVEQREVSAADISRLIEDQLQLVSSLEDDRVLRRLYQLVLATKRTNFFQLDSEGRPNRTIALKIASREIADLPEPKPYREIFVSSPDVEGVHLRFGAAARGGLRWSDRRDDFRTEVLGLVKAQQVKNAVIVPVGAKGGFVVKCARPSDPAAFREAGKQAYRAFLSAMLDITDNLDSDGQPTPPARTVCHDEPDPYLVVAADKGTATFSDIANEVATSRGFWLGDAFASGGSAGYDHKAMAITARGAWEAVKRHFREVGKGIQSEPFTAVGVGDMSGDVFGNGMLLSRKTRLVAAFDHRDIFIDPDPDPEASWAERKRLFELQGSSWQDYDRARISKGGAVISRGAKSASLSPEARAVLGIEQETLTPTDLIKAILRAPVELLYMGGIGTYVKSAAESHLDVSDKANDAIRVDGCELKASIVGEGANLGFTQAGRIEFARRGGRINTDAIDNSAGVDSSDLEVNIKILTSDLERRGDLSRPDRNVLLVEMTDEVAEHVLAHNHSQTLAVSLVEADAPHQLAEHAHFIAELEASGRLNRAVEGLPDAAALEERRDRGECLARPELAVLLAYGKLDFFDELIATGAPDDPYFERILKAYFPKQLERFEEALVRHRLRREIIATAIGNRLIDVAGPSFPHRLRAALGCDAATVAVAFAAADEIFGLHALWSEVDSLDNRAGADVQSELYLALVRAYRRQTHAIAARLPERAQTVEAAVAFYSAPVQALIALGADMLSDRDRDALAQRVAGLTQSGVPAGLAQRIALLSHLGAAIGIAEVAQDQQAPLTEVARLHSAIGARLGFHRFVAVADDLARGADPYEGLALRRLKSDLRAGQEALTRKILGQGRASDPLAAWIDGNAEMVSTVTAAVDRVEKSPGSWTLAKLLVAVSALLKL